MIEENCLKLNETIDKVRGKTSYNLKEIQKLLGVCRSTATKIVKAKYFLSIRVGREVRIPKAAFDAWLNNQKKGDR